MTEPVLATPYLGLDLSGPVIASASPLTGRLESLRELQDAGVSAVVLPSLFEEEVVAEEMAFHEAQEQGAEMFGEFTHILPEVPMTELGPDRHVSLVSEAKEALSIPVIASVNAAHLGSWSRYAAMMADAGADAIELNLYAVEADASQSADQVEDRQLAIIAEVKKSISVPLTVKLSPYYSSFANFAGRVVDAGADGLVLFNRFYGPDLDLETLDVTPKVELSSPGDQRLPLRWLGILSSHLPQTSLACTSGVHSADEVLKALLVGADVACTTSAVLHHGAGQVRTMLDGVRSWMVERDYESVEQLRGSVNAAAAEDPSAFERSQYMKIITSLSAKF